MGEVIQFIPKAERERLRLIRKARAMYDSVFPSSNSSDEQLDKSSITRASGPNIHHGDNVPS